MDAGLAPELTSWGSAMPSSLRARVMSTMPLPASDMSKMRLTTGDVSGSSSRVGRFFGPVLHHDAGVAVGRLAAETQKPREAASRIPRKTSWARFSL